MFVEFISGLGSATPLGPAGGDLSGTYPNPNVIAFHETTGPTRLAYGSVPDTTFLQRVGLTVVGTDPNTFVKGPWSSVLYVDNVRGNDTTGTRGNDNRPFATIQAAINAASSADVVKCAPQLFTITAELVRPASLTTFVLEGSGRDFGSAGGTGGTLIRQTTAGQAVINLSTQLGLTGCTIRYISLRAQGSAQNAILANGATAGYASGAFLTSPGLAIEQTNIITGNLTLQYVGNVLGYGGTWNGITLTATSCGGVTLSGVVAPGLGGVISFDTDDASAPGFNSGLALIQGTLYGGVGTPVTLTKQGRLLVDQSSVVGGVKGAGLTVNAGGTQGPSLSCNGGIMGANGGILDFASAGAELPDTALALTFDLRGATLFGRSISSFGAVTAAQFKVGGAAGNFQTVRMDDCVALPAITVTANAKIHLIARGADFPQAVYTTPGADGDIIPPGLSGTVDVSAGGALVRTWVQLGYAGLIRVGTTTFRVQLTAGAALSDTFCPGAGKALTGFTITSVAAAGNTANWLADFN